MRSSTPRLGKQRACGQDPDWVVLLRTATPLVLPIEIGSLPAGTVELVPIPKQTWLS
jgi:hypothetical protein